jgi:C-terminal processing protease CtpA/Prc
MRVRQDANTDESESDEEEEDAVAMEAEAEQRVRALLFNQLATKRVDGDMVRMDMFPDADAQRTPAAAAAAHSAAHGTALRADLFCKVAVFNDEQLGMVLQKGKKGEAAVASAPRQSPAARAGVAVGDIVVGVNAVRTSDFNQILWLLRNAERPMHLILLPAAET